MKLLHKELDKDGEGMVTIVPKVTNQGILTVRNEITNGIAVFLVNNFH